MQPRPRNQLARVAALEGQAAAHEEAAAIVAEAQRPRPPVDFQSLLYDLLRAKLEASHAVAEASRALLSNPAWVARQDAAGLEALGAYLDESAMNLGDRLAAATQRGRPDEP